MAWLADFSCFLHPFNLVQPFQTSIFFRHFCDSSRVKQANQTDIIASPMISVFLPLHKFSTYPIWSSRPASLTPGELNSRCSSVSPCTMKAKASCRWFGWRVTDVAQFTHSQEEMGRLKPQVIPQIRLLVNLDCVDRRFVQALKDWTSTSTSAYFSCTRVKVRRHARGGAANWGR